jgi:hypothetical protein
MRSTWNLCKIEDNERSYEDYFSEKIVNLQTPFYFIPYRLKNNPIKSSKEKDVIVFLNSSFLQKFQVS